MDPSGSTDEKERAMQQRIVTHMNADHRDSVVRYLEHYKGLSSFTARNARLEKMDLDSLGINCAGKLYTIPLDPPLSSLKEARERVVQMDKDAIAGLGRSEVTIKEYRAPRGFHAVVFGLCLFTYIAFSRRQNVLPGSLVYDYLLKYVPGSGYFASIQPAVLWLMVGIHLAEAVVMARRLGKHSVPLGSRLWWTWVVSCFVDGYGSFQRLDALVREKAKQKH
ncbi:hypothetical protein H2201_004313 [Coniosporium apollinis]|uniref:DUF2470 domain-containing protein n=2 Tax=Coniosporium TaxID=2810619 RepID=A0ABQ9NVE2_9PEZI|nr:hypothetical protein H2199_000080 [Cladosporium sp. JES 115]KAJ9665621.1 hypothetical protein H2201_004313 [Coniosporium apollinis]